MQKMDFKKQDKAYYTGKVGRFDLLEIPPLQYLMIDGHGSPAGLDYGRAIVALYGVSYGLKFHCKKALERDHVVAPLEGLWWADDMASYTERRKDAWDWTMMIRQPDWVDATMLAEVLPLVIAKNTKKKDAPTDTADLENLRLESFDEGLCVQVLHVGPYDDEGPVLAELHSKFIPENGLMMTGKHHEIYIGDPRKVASEKLKTILRQPVFKTE